MKFMKLSKLKFHRPSLPILDSRARNRRPNLEISTTPTKAKSQEPAYSYRYVSLW